MSGLGSTDLALACVYVSGSAFKLVNHRAYHHGTMLIDAQLSNLRGVLGTKKVGDLTRPFLCSGADSDGRQQEGMITKGVASVPSPVRNLKEWNADLDHERFVEQVSQEFARRYNVSDEVQVRHSSSVQSCACLLTLEASFDN